MAKRKQSKYALKGAAYPYSKHLRDWERAIKTGDVEAARISAEDHERQFGYTRKRAARKSTRGLGNEEVKIAA